MTASLFARLAVASKVIALTKIPSVMSSDKKIYMLYIYLIVYSYLFNFEFPTLHSQISNNKLALFN